MKLSIRHFAGFLALVILSVAFGLTFDGVATALEKRSHPCPPDYAPYVSASAAAFGVPEKMIWAVIKQESDFTTGMSASGRVGLMQLTPEQYDFVCREILSEEPTDPGILYDPSTNIRVGTAYISFLYRRYGVWDTVYAALYAGHMQVDSWLQDPAYVDERGRLCELPTDAADYVEELRETVALYEKLYF